MTMSIALFRREVGLLLLLAVFAACTEHPQVTIHAAAGPVHVPVELAVTPEARTRGLMYRRDLPSNAGMLFVFPQERPQQFWMRNTPLPLDLIFISAARRVAGVVADARPFSETMLGVPAPSQYVLEVHAGFAARHRIAAGDVVDFIHVPPPRR